MRVRATDYVVPDRKKEYWIMPGGRCQKESYLMDMFSAQIICPKCKDMKRRKKKVFNDQWTYEAHYRGVHMSMEE